MNIVIETLHDTIMMIPVLFVTYLVIEYLEGRASNLDKMIYRMAKAGPFYGALIGLVPQCGFSVLAASLFIDKKITLGTLIAVFIASNDEAIPLMIAQEVHQEMIWHLLIGKFILALMIGYLCDFVFEKRLSYRYGTSHDKEHEHHIFIHALIKTIKIYSYVFLVNIVISLAMLYFADEISQVLENPSLQIVSASLFGFIPNCAISVIVISLYMQNMMSFAAVFAALISNTGLGLLVLLKSNIAKGTLIKIILLLWISAIAGGLFYLWI